LGDFRQRGKFVDDWLVALIKGRWMVYDPGVGLSVSNEKLPVRMKKTSGIDDSDMPQAPVVF
jgi:hypothetical protein